MSDVAPQTDGLGGIDRGFPGNPENRIEVSRPQESLGLDLGDYTSCPKCSKSIPASATICPHCKEKLR